MEGDGDGDGMFSNAGDAAEKNQTRTSTLDQEQEDDRKEKEAEVEADSDAGCSIDPLRDEIQGLQDKKWVLELQLAISEATNRFLADEVNNLEDELVCAQQGLAETDRLKRALKDLEAQKALIAVVKALLEAHADVFQRQLLAAAEKEGDIRGLQEMVKEMGTQVRDHTKNLRLTSIKALEEAKTRLERALAEFRTEVGERDAALAAMKNAVVVPRVVAAVMSAGAIVASAAAVYFRKVNTRQTGARGL